MSFSKHLNISQPPPFPPPPTPLLRSSPIPPHFLPFFVYHKQQQHKKNRYSHKLKMVETVDADPIHFNFNNESINSPASDTLSLYSTTYDSHQISRDELATYFKTIQTRDYATVPAVGHNGLPALEYMQIDHFDPAMAEKLEKHYTRRGSYYLLMFLKKNIGFKPARSFPFNIDLHVTESFTSLRSRITSKRSASPTTSSSSTVIKSDGKYLLNMGTIRVRGYKKQKDFKIIVDPNFPFSYIDIDTIIGQTAAVKAISGAYFSSSFKVVATPEFDPESQHNRVSIDVEIIPWGQDFDDSQSLKSLPNTVKTSTTESTACNSSTLQSPPLSPTSPTMVSSPKKKKMSFFNFKRPPNYYQPPSGFSLFAPIPQNLQVNGNKKQMASSDKNNLAQDSFETVTNDRASSCDKPASPAESPDRFKKRWAEASDEIITLMELNLDYPCILGKDWINRLNDVVHTQ